MKSNNLLFVTILFTISFIALHCANNDKSKTSLTVNNPQDSLFCFGDNNLEQENLIINQTLNSIIDSLNHQIKINIGKKTSGVFDTIYISESLYKTYLSYKYVSSFYNTYGISLKEENYNKKDIGKLTLESNKKINGYNYKLIISKKDYERIEYEDFRIFLVFSRVYLNPEQNEAIFSLNMSCYKNSGLIYAISAKKNNNIWSLKNINEIAVR